MSMSSNRRGARRRLKARIDALGYKHKQIADELGITPSTFSTKMSGAAFTEDELTRLVSILDLSIDQIVFAQAQQTDAVMMELVTELRKYPPYMATYLTELIRLLQTPS